MMRFRDLLPAPACRGVLALAAVATLASPVAVAQGTDAQREACAPDAIRLCEDTIPDVTKTTACMKRHYTELSPRCRTAFDDVVDSGGPVRKRGGVAKREDASTESAPGEAAAPAPERVPGLHAYESHIREICRQGLVDPFTCRNTLDALKLGE